MHVTRALENYTWSRCLGCAAPGALHAFEEDRRAPEDFATEISQELGTLIEEAERTEKG